MYTLGETTKKIIDRAESWSINLGAVCNDILPKGSIVKLLSTGNVTAVTAATDVPFGVLSVGTRAVGDLATINTQFCMIARGRVEGASVVIGDTLNAVSIDGTEKLTNYTKSVAGASIVGIALSAGADEADIQVGILRVFQPIPA